MVCNQEQVIIDRVIMIKLNDTSSSVRILTHYGIVMRLLHTLGKDTHNTVLLNPLENNKSPVRLGCRSMSTWTKRSG